VAETSWALRFQLFNLIITENIWKSFNVKNTLYFLHERMSASINDNMYRLQVNKKSDNRERSKLNSNESNNGIRMPTVVLSEDSVDGL
jgi:hypothetical protein